MDDNKSLGNLFSGYDLPGRMARLLDKWTEAATEIVRATHAIRRLAESWTKEQNR